MSACRPAIAWNVYNGVDNDVALAIEAADGAIMSSLAGLTRVTLVVGTTTIDSDVDGSSVVWWTDSATYLGSTIEVLKFRLGGLSIDAGTYTDCALTIYDTTYTGGLRIGNSIKVTVTA